MSRRTTVLLDDETRTAARELALKYECSVSEAIRRAILAQRRQAFGVSEQRRQQRLEAFERLIDLFEGHDAKSEIDEIEAEDEHV